MGEKNLLDPVLYHDDDGTWHVYYKDRPEGGKDCHAVSWGKDNLTDWGRQNWVDNDLDRARMKKAREGSGIWRLTKTQVEKLGKSEWHPGSPCLRVASFGIALSGDRTGSCHLVQFITNRRIVPCHQENRRQSQQKS